MKIYRKLFTVSLLMLFVANLGGQQRKVNRQDKLPEATKVKKNLKPQLYLGKSGFCGGKIKVSTFDSLLRQGVSCHDSDGRQYDVIGFNFDYYERKIYEDSAANMIFLTDYSTEYCLGDTVSESISRSIYSRIKSGDTAAFDRVTLVRKNTQNKTDTFLGTGMKCYLDK